MNPRFADLHIVPRLGLMVSLFVVFQSVAVSMGTLITYQLLGADTAKIQEGILTNYTDWLGFMVLQGVASLVGFGLTAIVFAYLEAGNFKQHLGFDKKVSVQILLYALFAVIVAQFFVEKLVQVNKLLPAPPEIMQMQERIDRMLEAATTFHSVGQFLIAAVVMALIPAVAEELFFRGLLMGDLMKSGIRPAYSIIVSGLIFSLVHFEFHNFLAIGVLGIFLGYLYYVSGSLWVCIAAHLLNNFMAVFVRYLVSTRVISKEFSEAETPMWLSILSLVLFAAILFMLEQKRKSDSSQNTSAYEM